jgi:hypothetical protein
LIGRPPILLSLKHQKDRKVDWETTDSPEPETIDVSVSYSGNQITVAATGPILLNGHEPTASGLSDFNWS